MEDIPNGFTGFSKRDPGFVSAGEAMRKRRAEAEYRKQDPERYRNSGKRAAQFGWQLPQKEAVPGTIGDSWVKRRIEQPKDMKRFLRVPDVTKGEEAPVYDERALNEIPETDRRWAWVQVDLAAIRHNTLAVKNTLSRDVKLMAVVKADGYGHGAVQCARTALNTGAEQVAVATVNEAIALREGMINAPILILSEPPVSSIPLLLAYHIMPSVYTAEFAVKYAEAADSIGLRAPYHLKINTGMNRIGVQYSEVIDFMRQIMFHRALELKGTFTHFATADDMDTMEIERANSRFMTALDMMRTAGINPGIVHAANSAASCRFPQLQYDMVRVGLSLYGYYSTPEMFGLIDLVPSMSVHARITDVRNVPLGEGVGYSLTYRSGGYAKICTIPVGYADGLRYGLSNRTDFVVAGRQYPQVGNICMDQCMFEVAQRSRGTQAYYEPEIGDEVLVVGSDGNAFVTIDEMAEKLGSMSYEITIGFGNSRLPRVYT